MTFVIITGALSVCAIALLIQLIRPRVRKLRRRGAHAKGAPRIERFLPDPPRQPTARADGGVPEFAPARVP